MKRLATVLVFASTLAASATALAQQTSLTAPPPTREHTGRVVIAPSLQYELTRPDDANFDPPGPRVHHDPAFIAPLSRETGQPSAKGRGGLAGWTSPNTAVGAPAAWREVTGWLAAGGAWTWGGPPSASTP